MAGLGMALVAFLILGTTGLTDVRAGAAILIFLQYGAQLLAGYVAGRLATTGRVLHGGIAGMVVAAIGAAVGLSLASGDASLLLIFIALVIATITGTAGGALAEHRARS